MVTSDSVLRLSPRALCLWLVISFAVVLNSVQFWYTWSFLRRIAHNEHLQHNDYLRQRKGRLVIVLLVAITAHAVFHPINLLVGVFVPGANSLKNPLFYARMFVYKSLLYAVGYVFVLRAWDLFTSLQSQRAAVKMQWMHSLRADASNWYLATQHTWGNPRWMVRVMLPPYLGTVTAITFAPLISLNVYAAINYSALALPMFAIAAIWWKMPLIEDRFQIRNELKYSVIFAAVIYTLFGVVAFGFQLTQFTFWYDIMAMAAAVVGCFGICLISTYWVMKQSGEHNCGCAEHRNAGIAVSDMKRILSDETGFDTFMAHLQTEFATENLLFLLELMNYKLSFFSEPNAQADIDSADVGFWMKFPSRQKVREMYCGIEEPTDRARRVWDKYLKDNAPLAVNIGWNSKTLLAKYFQFGQLEEDPTILFSLPFLFDRAAKEIRTLLKDSWVRFSQSDECKRLAEVRDMRQRSTLVKLASMSLSSRYASPSSHSPETEPVYVE